MHSQRPIALLLVTLLLSACTARVPARTAPTPPAADVEPPGDTVARGVREFRYAPGTHRFELRQDAVIEALETGIADSVTTLTYLTYTLSDTVPGDLIAVTGTIDSFAVITGDSIPRPLHTAAFPIPFTATMDQYGWIHEFASPDTSSCGSPAGALLAAAREVLVPVASGLSAGAGWQDSTTTTTCRGDIPITTVTVREHRVVSDLRDGEVLEIRRAGRTRITGTGTRPVQTTTISGTGASSMEILLDPGRGMLRSATGESESTLTFDAASRRETFRQRVQVRIRSLPEI